MLLLAGLSLLAGCRSAGAEEPPADAARYLGRGMPYTVLDELPATSVAVKGGSIKVAFAPGPLALSRKRILDWIAASAESVAVYYGRFPVDSARLLVIPIEGRGVRSGTTYAFRGAAIKLRIGELSEEAHLIRDWVLVHEMVHLAFPSVDERHHWIEEGLATYVEGVARVQAGKLNEDEVWSGLVDGLPKGLPQAGDHGLDHTPTWGRTYWGGALFCLLADVEIRKQTANRKGLQDALRGILAAGGNMEVHWPITKAFQAGDAATGVSVLVPQYERMKDRPVDVDLPDLWRRLGVAVSRRDVVYQKDAPLAAIRRAITANPKLS
jgi:hypothetical protein